MTVTVENSGRRWLVRVWCGGIGSVVWEFKSEAEARRLAMNIQDATTVKAA